MTPIGFIGLGIMGAPMAERLVSAGLPLVVHTRTRAHAQRALAAGARWAPTPAAVAEQCATVVSVLLDWPAAEAVYAPPAGMLAAAWPGQLFIEHATLDPARSRELAAHAERAGAAYVDAPVSGGPEGAREGQLVCMAGGDRNHRERLESVVRHYASRIRWVGPSGAGSTLKLVNQMLVTCHAAAAAEAGALLRAAGLDTGVSLEALSGGFAASRLLERCLPLIGSGQFSPSGSQIAGLAAAQDLVTTFAAGSGVDARTFQAARSRFDEAARAGKSHLDIAAV